MIGLYIHIPFCIKKCAYCDFISFPDQLSFADRYILCLCRELENRADSIKGEMLDTVYIGGGTPTLLSMTHIEKIMVSLKRHFIIEADAEITIEANPETISLDYLKALLQQGFNRLSIGIQTLQQAELNILGRVHTAATAQQAIQNASTAGFENINVDLMMGLPMQTPETAYDSVMRVLEYEITHLSAYTLKLEPGTLLKEMVEKGRAELPDEGQQEKIEQAVREGLQGKGLHRYEISNYARPGFESKHNLKYWNNEQYIGIGCGAFSRVGQVRSSNENNLFNYMKRIEECSSAVTFTEHINQRLERVETLMLALRLCDGFSISDMNQRLDLDIEKHYANVLEKLKKNELLSVGNGRIWLTERGLDLQNMVMLEFME